MSEFLMIVPQDFIEIQDAPTFFSNHIDEATLTTYINEGNFWPITNVMEDLGQLVPGEMVVDARVFSSRLWIKWGPEA